MATVTKSYITSSDILIPSALKTYLEGDAGATSITTAITEASAEIDSYLGEVYDVPLHEDLITAHVKRLTKNIAIYNLYMDVDSNAPESIIERYKETLESLKKIVSDQKSVGAATQIEQERSKGKTAEYGRA